MSDRVENKNKMKDIFTSYIRDGIKNNKVKALGVEVEHFILDSDTLESTSYYGDGGVKEIVLELMKKYPDAKPIIGEDILGFEVKDFNITLEPAAQIEISIAASDDISYIKKIYNGFYDNLSKILNPLGKVICTIGCQPVSHVDDLDLIPKGRYRLMDEHFKKTGTGGREMMRGSASAQVSVDYFSEEDFRRKIQAAYYFMPLFKLVSDKAVKFQGEDAGHLKRTDIWNRTDPARCGILPGIFKPDYGFSDYAEYVCHVPLILVPREDGEKYTEFAVVSDIYDANEIGRKEIDHIFSMPFPDVRVKHYLEIRGADSMPLDGVLSLCALVKGLIYSEEVLDYVQDQIRTKGIDEAALRTSDDSLMKSGFDGEIFGIPARDFVKDAFIRCEKGLTDLEKEYLHGWDVKRFL